MEFSSGWECPARFGDKPSEVDETWPCLQNRWIVAEDAVKEGELSTLNTDDRSVTMAPGDKDEELFLLSGLSMYRDIRSRQPSDAVKEGKALRTTVRGLETSWMMASVVNAWLVVTNGLFKR